MDSWAVIQSWIRWTLEKLCGQVKEISYFSSTWQAVPVTLTSIVLFILYHTPSGLVISLGQFHRQWSEISCSEILITYGIIFTLMRLIIEHHRRLVYVFILALLIFQVSYWPASGDRIRVFTPKITIANENAPGLMVYVAIS